MPVESAQLWVLKDNINALASARLGGDEAPAFTAMVDRLLRSAAYDELRNRSDGELYSALLALWLAGGTLNLNGRTSTFGNLTVTASSVIDFGNGTNSTVTVNSLGVAGGQTLSVTNWTNFSDYFYSVNNPGSQGTAPINQVVFTGYTGNDTRWTGTHAVSPVPEPAHYGAALLLGSLGLGWWLRRRRAQR